MEDPRKRKLELFSSGDLTALLALLSICYRRWKNSEREFISYQENMDTSSPLGQALFTIVAAVAQLERDLIRERVSAGIRNARAAGKQLGRPRRIVDRDEILGSVLKVPALGRLRRRSALVMGRCESGLLR
jgi:DNA invertase Pin-like site-specific DNA recombinase